LQYDITAPDPVGHYVAREAAKRVEMKAQKDSAAGAPVTTQQSQGYDVADEYDDDEETYASQSSQSISQSQSQSQPSQSDITTPSGWLSLLSSMSYLTNCN